MFCLQKLLEDGVDSDNKEGLLWQSKFVQNWLHALVTTLPQVKQSNQLPQAAAITVTCCKKYVHLMKCLNLDKTSIVPQLVYHILHAIQEKVTHYIFNLSLNFSNQSCFP